AREQDHFQVRAPAIEWAQLSGSASARAVIPGMRTDVLLQRPGYAAIVETKFYGHPFVGHYGARRVPSAHLYQLYAYLRNFGLANQAVDGVLLYAEPGEALDEEFVLQGHRLRVLTLNLSLDWPE